MLWRFYIVHTGIRACISLPDFPSTNSAVIMPSGLIGSTGVLKPLQCQSDIWVTLGDPCHPVPGDTRLIAQGVNPMAGIIYAEGWHHGEWLVQHFPQTMVTSETPNGPPIALQNIPIHFLTNQNLLGNEVIGQVLTWADNLYLRTINGEPFYYIKHKSRNQDEIYLQPLQDSIPQAITVLEWRTQ